MKRYLILILVAIFVLASGVLVGCGQKPESPASPTAPEQTEPTPESPSPQDWEVLNRWLGDLYGLPPVENTEQLESAAWLVSIFWFEQADKAVKKLEEDGIPWERTAPFCYLFNYYILYDTRLTNAKTPLEFMAADHPLADSVKALQDEAEELVHMKWLGEPLKIFPTTKDAMESFKEIDKDWERLMEEAVNKGK